MNVPYEKPQKEEPKNKEYRNPGNWIGNKFPTMRMERTWEGWRLSSEKGTK